MNWIALLTGLGMVTAGVAPIPIVRRMRDDAPHAPPRWSFFFWGALGWLLTGLLLKAITAAPLADVLQHAHGPRQWIALGLLTGVSECAMFLGLAACVPALRRTTWVQAIAVGVGFGAAEALVVSLDAFFSDSPAQSPPPALGEALTQILAPTLERFNAMFVHAFACALILLALRTRAWRWFWLAFLYKTVADGIPVEKLQIWGAWAMEAAYIPFGLLGAFGLWASRRRWPENGDAVSHDVSAIR
jgi:MFS family permease